MITAPNTRLLGTLAIVVLATSDCGSAARPLPAQCTSGGSRLDGDASGRPACHVNPDDPSTLVPPTCGVSHQSGFVALPATTAHEAEIALAVDPRPMSQLAYVATIRATTATGVRQAAVTGKCIVKKTIQVFRTTDLGASWTAVAGTEQFATDWLTDPDLTIDEKGTMYLSALRAVGSKNNAVVGGSVDTNGNPSCDGTQSDNLSEVQIWMAHPDGPLEPAIASGFGVLASLGQPSPAIQQRPVMTNPPADAGLPPLVSLPSGNLGNTDHPRIIASRAGDGRVVVSVLDKPDFVVTYQRDPTTGFLTETGNRLALTPTFFSALVMDAQGDLYIGSANGTELGVRRLHWNGTAWTPVMVGGQENRGAPALPQGAILLQGNPAISLTQQSALATAHTDPPAGLAVINLDATSDPIVYMAFEIQLAGTTGRQIEVVAGNGADLRTGRWASPQIVQGSSSSRSLFHPHLSADGNNNILDLVYFDAGAAPGGGTGLAGFEVRTMFARYDASRRNQIYQTLLNRSIPLVSDLPARNSVGDNGPKSLFTGEYLGIATKGVKAIAAWPERPAGASGPASVNSDLGLSTVGDERDCTTAKTGALLAYPDDRWECQCACGTFLPLVVGCAVPSSEGDPCDSICGAKTPCGEALSCTQAACTSTESRRLLSRHSCAVLDGPPAGAPPASNADFAATATAASAAVLHVGGQTVSASLGGQVYVSASTSPPTAGAVAEVSRFDVRPADVFVGGSVNATVRNVGFDHRSRLRGTFTDAKHFSIEAGATQFIVTLQTQTAGDPVSAPVSLLATNTATALGVLDLAAGTLSFDTTATTATGDSVDIHYRGTITSRPPDSDHDGIIDAVDRCPGTAPGPDRTPPVFTFVPPDLTITSCTGGAIGQATATDPCGVTITKDAPAKFPLGTTVVRWTARDNAGNVTVATQNVTAVLGDNTSCCPAGTNVIVGTSNNDVLTGTAGADCILGRGGQDRISGGGGNDFISGGDGDDTIFGQDGNDQLFGGTGQDVISGGAGDDVLFGGDGVDQLNGDDGNDRFSGGQGGDILHGGAGDDFLAGDDDDDQIFGGDGNDVLDGGLNNDRLYGEAGNDTLIGGDGDNLLDGGSGTNAFSSSGLHDQCIDNSASFQCEPAEGDE